MREDRSNEGKLAAEKFKRFMQDHRSRPPSSLRGVRPQVDEITTDALQETPDKSLSKLVNDYVCTVLRNMPENVGKRPPLNEFVRQFPPRIQMIFSTLALEGEVCNGGFSAFYSNSTGCLGPDALAGFELLGAASYAELMRRAIQCHANHNADYGDLDKEFLSLRKLQPLDVMRCHYIRDYASEFVTTKS